MISKNCALRIVESCFIPKTRMWENAPDISNMSMCIYSPSILWKMEYCDETHAYGHVPEREMAGIQHTVQTKKVYSVDAKINRQTPPRSKQKKHTQFFIRPVLLCVSIVVCTDERNFSTLTDSVAIFHFTKKPNNKKMCRLL